MKVSVETATNLAIVAVCVVLMAVLADQYIVPRLAPPAEFRVGLRNDRANVQGALPDVDLGKAQLTALVMVDSACRLCVEGTTLYRKMLEISQRRTPAEFQVMFLGTRGAEDGRAFLTRQGLNAKVVTTKYLSTKLADRVRGTPVLLLVDSHGTIQDSYIGKLPKETEEAFLAKIEVSK